MNNNGEKGRDRVRMGEKTAAPPVSLRMNAEAREAHRKRLAKMYGVEIENVSIALLPLGTIKKTFSEDFQEISKTLTGLELIPTQLILRYSVMLDIVKKRVKYFDVTVEIEDKDMTLIIESAQMAFQEHWDTGFIGPPALEPIYTRARAFLQELTRKQKKDGGGSATPHPPRPVFMITNTPVTAEPLVQIFDSNLAGSPMKRLARRGSRAEPAPPSALTD